MAKDQRKYPCPKCDTGEAYDTNAGGMFIAQIRCTNPDCDFTEDEPYSDLITSE